MSFLDMFRKATGERPIPDGGQRIGSGDYIDPWQDRVKPNVAHESANEGRVTTPCISGDLRGRTGINIVEQPAMQPGAKPHTGGEGVAGPQNPLRVAGNAIAGRGSVSADGIEAARRGNP